MSNANHPSHTSSPPLPESPAGDDNTEQQPQQGSAGTGSFAYDYRNSSARYGNGDGHGVDAEGEASLSPLEREVLDEYARLRENLDKVGLFSHFDAPFTLLRVIIPAFLPVQRSHTWGILHSHPSFNPPKFCVVPFPSILYTPFPFPFLVPHSVEECSRTESDPPTRNA